MRERRSLKPFSLGADLENGTRDVFTGREHELQEFATTLLARKNWSDETTKVKRIFNIHGQGGAGKSTLLREYETLCRQHNVEFAIIDAQRSSGHPVNDIIEFLHIFRSYFSPSRYQTLTHSNPFNEYDQAYRRYKDLEIKVNQYIKRASTPREYITIHRTIGNIVVESSSQGSNKDFTSLTIEPDTSQQISKPLHFGTAQTFQEHLTNALGNVDDVDFFRSPESVLIEKFSDGLYQLFSDNVFVLMLDTYEQIENIDTAIRDQLLSSIDANLIIVFSGRNSLYDRLSLRWRDETHFFEMRAFTLAEVKDFLQKHKLDHPNLAEAIYNFTQGWPLAVGLALDLLRKLPDKTTAFQTLTVSEEQSFAFSEDRNKVIDGVTRRFLSQVPESELSIIWVAAILNNFDVDIIQYFHADQTFSENDLRRLFSYSFISPLNGGYVIHDLVRSYVLRYLRKRQAKTYSALHQQAAKYYAQKLEALKEQQYEIVTSNEDWRTALIENTYHILQADHDQGLYVLLYRVAETISERDIDLALQLLQVTKRPITPEGSNLSRLIECCYLIKGGNDERARRLLEEEVKRIDVSRAQRYAVAFALGVMQTNWPFHQYKAALEAFQTALDCIYNSGVPSLIIDCLRWQGYCYGHLQRWDDAQGCLQKALGFAEGMAEPNTIIRCQLQIAQINRSQGNLKEAARLLSMIDMKDQHIPVNLKIDILEEQGHIHQTQGLYINAIRVMRQMCSVAAESAQPERLAKAWQTLGQVYRNYGDFKEALHCFAASGHIAEEISNDGLRTHIDYEIGMTHIASGDFAEGSTLLIQSCKAYEELGQKSAVVIIWYAIAETYSNWGKFAQAHEYYQLAREQFITMKQSADIADLEASVGAMEAQRGSYQPAIQHYQQALHQYIQLDQPLDIANIWKNIGDTYRQWGRFTESEEHYQEAKKQYILLGRMTDVAEVLLCQGLNEQARGDYMQAASWLISSRALFALQERPLDEARLLNQLGTNYRLWGNFDKAAAHYTEARTRYEQLDRPADVANVLLGLGLSERARGNYALAVDWLTQSRDCYTQLNRPLDVANLWSQLGITYREWGQFDLAATHYAEARTRYEQLDHPADVADVLLGLGLSEQARGNYALAVDWLTQSRDCYTQLNLQSQVANLSHWLGITFQNWGHFSDAVDALQKAQALYAQLGAIASVAAIFRDLGLNERARGNYALAVDWLTQSRDCYTQLNRPLDTTYLWHYLAETYRLWGQFEQAAAHYTEARTRYEQLDRPADVADVLLGLGLSERARGNYAGALERLNAGLALYVQEQHQSKIAEFMGRIADIYLQEGDHNQAEQRAREALIFSKQLGFEAQVVRAILTLSSALIKLDHLELAKQYCLEAQSHLTNIDSLEWQASVSIMLGRIEYLNNGITTARQYFEEAIALFAKRNFPRDRALAWRELGECYLDLKEYDMAYEAFSEAKQIFVALGIHFQIEQIDAFVAGNA